jgi:uncharacterized protein YerC
MTVDTHSPSNALDLLNLAREAREGRDRWRAVGPTLVELVDQGISYSLIEQLTGISEATAHRIVRQCRALMSGNTSSAAGSSTPATAVDGT